MSLRGFGSSSRRAAIALAGMLCASACVAPSVRDGAPPPQLEEIVALATTVREVTGARAEVATDFAALAFKTSRELARDYELVWPPMLHNSLVNAGMRERGLCHQFADDLAARLLAEGPWPWDLRAVVAREDSYWRAHHAIVIGHAGMSLGEWLLLDPWRHSGQLHWSRVSDDEVPWIWWRADRSSDL